MGLSAKDLIAKASPPELVIRVCVNGALRGEHSALVAELEEIKPTLGKLSGGDPHAAELAQRITDLEQQMAADVVAFRFRAVSPWRLKEIQRAFPTEEKGMAWDVDAGAPTLIADCLVEPAFTAAEVRELSERGNQGLLEELLGAAWRVCTERNDVPKSARASALIRGTAQS